MSVLCTHDLTLRNTQVRQATSPFLPSTTRVCMYARQHACMCMCTYTHACLCPWIHAHACDIAKKSIWISYVSKRISLCNGYLIFAIKWLNNFPRRHRASWCNVRVLRGGRIDRTPTRRRSARSCYDTFSNTSRIPACYMPPEIHGRRSSPRPECSNDKNASLMSLSTSAVWL